MTQNEYASKHGMLGELRKAFGKDGSHWSCLGWDGERKLKHLVMQAIKTIPNPYRGPLPAKAVHIVEIGTHQGVSSALLSHLGKVTTFDIKHWPLRTEIHKHFACETKVDCHVCEDSAEIYGILGAMDFDLAFVDGCHAFDAVRADFEAVKKCGRVIFHDFEPRLHGDRTVRFVNTCLMEGRTTKLIPFALWESEEKAGASGFMKVQGKKTV